MTGAAPGPARRALYVRRPYNRWHVEPTDVRRISPHVPVEARIAPDSLAVLRRAAEIQGRSLSDFLVAAALKSAHETIAEAQIVRLSIDDQHRFAELLLAPPPLAPAMKDALAARKRLLAGAD